MKFSSSSSAMSYLLSTANVDTAGEASKVLVVSDAKGLSTLSAADSLLMKIMWVQVPCVLPYRFVV